LLSDPRRQGVTPIEIQEIVRSAPFHLYGLVNAHDDVRWLAQYDALPSHIVLGHGDPRAEPERWVKVGVMLRDPGALFAAYSGATIDIRETLAGMYAAAEGKEGLLHRWEEARLPAHGKELMLDGIREPFAFLGNDAHWIAYREQPETWLFIHSRRVPPSAVELVRVDPDPYVRGLREFLATP
jgi:hypothetical protein